jgi:hypothetical protein
MSQSLIGILPHLIDCTPFEHIGIVTHLAGLKFLKEQFGGKSVLFFKLSQTGSQRFGFLLNLNPLYGNQFINGCVNDIASVSILIEFI